MTNEEAIRLIDDMRRNAIGLMLEKKQIDALDMAIEALKAQDKALHEFCTDCKEYDQERHCCPRFNRVISETLKEVQSGNDINVRGKDTVYRQDAINHLIKHLDDTDVFKSYPGMKSAIAEWLNELPATQLNRVDSLDNSIDTISRQDAIDYVDDVPYIKEHPNIGLLWKAWLEQLPSVEPEIIRCKDCAHCADDWNGNQPMFTCELGSCGESVYPNYHCSLAERRTDEEVKPRRSNINLERYEG